VIRKSRTAGLLTRVTSWVYAIYLDPRALLREGRLPPFEEAKRSTGSLTYLVKDPKAYGAAKINTC